MGKKYVYTLESAYFRLLTILSEYHDCRQVNGPRTHLDKDFLMALPDLLETRHVQIDNTARIIYYNTLLHGSMLDHEDFPTKREIVNRISESCIRIGASWLELAGSTAADLSAACIMVRLTLILVHTTLDLMPVN